MVKVKVCGITNLDDALECIKLGVDALGFIFAKSKRRVEKEVAKEIIDKLPPFITSVGVFVDEDKEKVLEIANLCGINVLQFHGNESIEYCKYFKDFKIIKSFLIKDKESLREVSNYKVSAYLFDTFKEGSLGGTGTTFNWEILKGFKFNCPFIISGGLNSENIESCLKILNPYAVDVCSGVEAYPGKKDRKKLREFLKSIKSFIP
jgi:phosphoribosylanthranilate isomerase